MDAWVNGTLAGSRSSEGDIYSNGGLFTHFGLDHFWWPINPYGRVQWMSEVLVYNVALTDAEVNAASYYLAGKYGYLGSAPNLTVPERVTLTINSNAPASGQVVPDLGSHEYFKGEVVSLNAATLFSDCPDIYEFSNWVVDVNVVSSPVTEIIMDGDKTVTVTYGLSANQCVTLTIETDPAGIDAAVTPAPGVYEFGLGETVNLSAVQRPVDCPDVWEFTSWSANVAAPASLTTSITLSGNTVVTASYADARVCGDECHPIIDYFDSDQNCDINMLDFAALAAEWLNCTHPDCD
jgi:hypothetical protein